MTPEHQELREALGAYVVGGLDPAERRRVEQHLADCRECTGELARLSPLPGLLSRVNEQEATGDLLVPPDGLLDDVIARLADERRTLRTRLVRWRAAAVAAAVATAGAVLVAIAPWETGPDRTVAAVEPVAAEAAATGGQAAAIPWEWGITVEVAVTDLPPRDRYIIWAVADDGRRERAGTWGPTASGAARVRGASSIDRADLARVVVSDPDGEALLSFDFAGTTGAAVAASD